jgi:hypothetical protein
MGKLSALLDVVSTRHGGSGAEYAGIAVKVGWLLLERQKRVYITSVGGELGMIKETRKEIKQQNPVAGVEFYNLGKRKRV